MHPKRTLVLFAALAIVMFAVTRWCGGVLSQGAAARSQSEQNLRQCRVLAASIAELRQRPTVTGSPAQRVADLARQIEQAAQQAGIQMKMLVRIWPQPARRLGDTAYLTKPTLVLLRHVTLRELITFLYTVVSGHDGLEATSVRITAPHDQETGDAWTAEATLNYLIYAPATDTERQVR